MRLYKYVANPENILKDGYIRATQLSALNDPFEANYSKEGLKELIREFDYTSKGEEFINYIEENKHKVGVISFTDS
jgi:Ca2+-binding EF-hand superfamily protein